jgi:ABC-type spermidine/putrescine transport system permease subunit II
MGDSLEEASRDLGAGPMSPELNAAATMMIAVTFVGLALAGLALRAGARQ